MIGNYLLGTQQIGSDDLTNYTIPIINIDSNAIYFLIQSPVNRLVQFPHPIIASNYQQSTIAYQSSQETLGGNDIVRNLSLLPRNYFTITINKIHYTSIFYRDIWSFVKNYCNYKTYPFKFHNFDNNTYNVRLMNGETLGQQFIGNGEVSLTFELKEVFE